MTALDPIRSLQNPRVKQLVRLREARERRRSGLTRVDGGRELLRALGAGFLPETLFVCPERLRPGETTEAFEAACAAGAPVQPLIADVYDKVRYGERDEGLCATIAWSPQSLAALRLSAPAFVLVVEGVEKPGNLGALLRTADAAGAQAVVLADPACDPANPNVVRASMGTLFTQPIASGSAAEARRWLSDRAIAPVLARPDARQLYTEVDLTGSVAVVLGAEHEGLSARWTSEGTQAVRLPMAGFSDSLNLAAAAAVLLYEVVRQRAAGAGSDASSTA